MPIEKLDIKKEMKGGGDNIQKIGQALVSISFKLNEVIDVLNGITQLIDNVDNERKREKED